MQLKECPNCGSEDLRNAYVYIQCNKCLMTGPQMNGGRIDAHCDHVDQKAAEEAWNDLPRKNEFQDLT